MRLSVVILTYNSGVALRATIGSAAKISDDIYVVDSFSSDNTCAVARESGANVVQHEFRDYAAQRNWAIENLPLKHQWELHLDADELLSEDLIGELEALKLHGVPAHINGYHVPRLVRFLGRPIRHGGMFPIWHMRLFRRAKGRCEEREYDQHFLVANPTARLRGAIVDDIRMPLREWVSRHNRWSDAAVRDLLRDGKGGPVLQPNLFGSPLERKRSFKSLYNRFPLFTRAFLLFTYRYIFRLGFLDGTEGTIFFFLQTFWYRFLIDAKLFEQGLMVGGESTDRDRAGSLLASPSEKLGGEIITPNSCPGARSRR
jgi:glycosyltransferase involved in cell wall biosynthesis